MRFLRASAAAFDAGDESEAKRLAQTLRNLLHDAKSKSLLTLLGVKHKLQYIDSADKPPADPPGPGVARLIGFASSLAPIEIGPHGTKFVAPLDTQPATAEVFSKWWTAAIARDHHRHVFSRKRVVLTVANQDGGAHIDLDLPADYAAMTRGDSFGRVGGVYLNPAPAIVRQIAYEVEATITGQLASFLSTSSD
jgi:hypothetical protein